MNDRRTSPRAKAREAQARGDEEILLDVLAWVEGGASLTDIAETLSMTLREVVELLHRHRWALGAPAHH